MAENQIITRMLTELIIYLFIGAVTGVLAGLFGIGGGTIIVPALILTLTLQGVSPDVSTHIAIGTSLAAISMTSLSSVYSHHLRGAVRWPLVVQLVPGVCIGVWLGAALASQLSGVVLQKCFGVFLVAIALQLFFALQPHRQAEQSLPWFGMWGSGAVIGFLSALFGIGGGSLSVPFLRWRGVVMQSAVATASAVGFPLAVAGAFSYAWQGWANHLLPPECTGFVYWPAFAGIAVTSIGFAKIGVQLAHALDAQKLQRIFALFSLCIGVYFLIRG